MLTCSSGESCELRFRNGIYQHCAPRLLRCPPRAARSIKRGSPPAGAIPGSPEAGHLAALKALWHLAYREASTLAFADAFHAIMLAFIAATLLVPLLRQVTPAKAPAADAH
jgi:hypothetical protein